MNPTQIFAKGFHKHLLQCLQQQNTTLLYISSIQYQCYICMSYRIYSVPTPVVIISAPNNLTTGQSVTLSCRIVAVRGITSRVDIVWYDNSVQVRRMDNVTASMINDTTAVYTDSLNVSILTRQHDGRVYLCEAIINSEPLLATFSYITLSVTCKFVNYYVYLYYTMYVYMLAIT